MAQALGRSAGRLQPAEGQGSAVWLILLLSPASRGRVSSSPRSSLASASTAVGAPQPRRGLKTRPDYLNTQNRRNQG